MCYFVSVYFPVDPKAGGSSVALMMMTSQSSRYLWKVRITQIDCIADPQSVGKLILIELIISNRRGSKEGARGPCPR